MRIELRSKALSRVGLLGWGWGQGLGDGTDTGVIQPQEALYTKARGQEEAWQI